MVGEDRFAFYKAEMMVRTIRLVILFGLILLACGCAGHRELEVSSVASDEPLDSARLLRLRVINPQVLQMERYGFAILDFSARRDHAGVVTVLGEVRNNGSVAKGVELRAILRGDNGRVIAERGFWPASLENLKPGEIRPFTFPLGGYENVAQIELQITRVRQWD